MHYFQCYHVCGSFNRHGMLFFFLISISLFLYFLLSCELMCFINVEQAQVIKTKSVKYMPFSLSLANFMNGAIWIVYSCLKFDLYILVNFLFHLFNVQPNRYIVLYLLKTGDTLICFMKTDPKCSWMPIRNNTINIIRSLL